MHELDTPYRPLELHVWCRRLSTLAEPPGHRHNREVLQGSLQRYSSTTPRAPSSERENSFDEQDDLEKDPTYNPQKGRRRTRGRQHTSAREKAMDDLDKIFMFVRGITPEEAAIRREKRLEEEQTAQEAGRRKVMEWIDTSRT